MYAVEGKRCEEGPRVWMGTGSYLKGIALRGGGELTQLRKLHISSSKHGGCQGPEAGGYSKETSVDSRKVASHGFTLFATRERCGLFMRRTLYLCLENCVSGVGWVEQRLVLPVGERLGHCAGGGRRDHILSISNYFCNSLSLKIPVYITVKYIPFNVLFFFT